MSDRLQGGNAGVIDHRWWAAHQCQRIVGRLKQVLLNHLIIDKTGAVLPTVPGPIHSVPELESVGVLGGLLFNLGSQQDVVLGLVGKQQLQLSLVLRVLEHVTDELQHWSDARTAGNQIHACGFDNVGRILAQLFDAKLTVGVVDQATAGATESNGIVCKEKMDRDELSERRVTH